MHAGFFWEKQESIFGKNVKALDLYFSSYLDV